jgi:hypothetical protein
MPLRKGLGWGENVVCPLIAFDWLPLIVWLVALELSTHYV